MDPHGRGTGPCDPDAVDALVDFARGAKTSDGFGFLDRDGRVDPSQGTACFVTARMTFTFSIASMLAIPDTAPLAAHGIASLASRFHDKTFGGFYPTLGGEKSAQRKRGYDTCFVALAAATAEVAGIAGADELRRSVARVIEDRFWSERHGALFESWDREFDMPEPYWGTNVNMHGVESMLALYSATGDPVWRRRAARIAETFIRDRASRDNWWLLEHYSGEWTPLPEFNADNPSDEFHPYGMTPGHLFEWSRLLLCLEYTYEQPPGWLRPAAAGLYHRAKVQGWAIDGADGFPYTVDWSGNPVIHDRPHWVATEAISAAAVWSGISEDPSYAEDLTRWSRYAQQHYVDPIRGSWHHLLDRDNEPNTRMWSGKPDTYHAIQALLLPRLARAESFTGAVHATTFGDKP